uniref:Angel homolog 2 (Drosophila) n=1 Tax=Dicentrarchus labrax TaxID=13489 RepID=A0A8C4NMG7_DICLA
MFLRQLSSFGSSFLPRSRPALCRAGFRSSSASSSYLPHFIPAPHPWWSVRGFPPWPPRLPHSHPAAHQVVSARTLHPQSINPADFGGRRSFHTSTGLTMERPNRDREPPPKRRKSAEENRSVEEREGHRGAAAGGRDGGSKREHHHLDSRADSRPRSNHYCKDGSRDRGNTAAGTGVSRENSRDRYVGRTRTGDKHRQRKDSAGRYDPQNRGRIYHQLISTKSFGHETPLTLLLIFPFSFFRASLSSALHRHWETPACSTGVQPPGGSAAFDFSVMSYNILSQELLQDNAYLYRHCNPAILHWNHRLPNLLAEIQLYNADILCLQEVQEDHYENQIKPALQALGYQCEYKKRTGNKPDGCAVIFKSSRLSLLSSNPVEFFRPGDALLDRDNVGLVVLLQPNDTTGQSDPSAFICVANTHLLYNPRRGDIKLAQLAILLAEINRLSRLPDGSTNPVVLCGDFNSTPPETADQHVCERDPRGQRLLTSPIWSQSLGIDYQCQYKNKPTADVELITQLVCFLRSRIEHGLKLQSSYQHHLMPDGRPEITTYHSRTAMTVDYILYTPESIAPLLLPAGRGLHLLGRLSLVGQSELEEVSGLPNHHHSSDHLPLLAKTWIILHDQSSHFI